VAYPVKQGTGHNYAVQYQDLITGHKDRLGDIDKVFVVM
jgi:hypothetical protein